MLEVTFSQELEVGHSFYLLTQVVHTPYHMLTKLPGQKCHRSIQKVNVFGIRTIKLTQLWVQMLTKELCDTAEGNLGCVRYHTRHLV